MGIFNVKKNLDKKCKDLSDDINETIQLLEATMELIINFIPELNSASADRLKDFRRIIDIGSEQASILANNRRVYFENSNFQRWFRYWENDIEYSAAGTKNFMNSLGRYKGKFDMLLNEISNLTSKTKQGSLIKLEKASKRKIKKSKPKKKISKVVKKIDAKKKSKTSKKKR